MSNACEATTFITYVYLSMFYLYYILCNICCFRCFFCQFAVVMIRNICYLIIQWKINVLMFSKNISKKKSRQNYETILYRYVLLFYLHILFYWMREQKHSNSTHSHTKIFNGLFH